ncbi:AAA family ATPase [Caballeronia sp. ATUFL_M2_KS44]|uniref:AAA family ATPase n=1 Tax=Caballeronia sp. ATUFL_M2_KS44 TaxID=2921767 RepID=UPI002027F957|nr:AAA family ATPase [Caballeronia sp. ATUFL_M2_KS44]
MPAISKLTIAGYKSIRELREFELRDLNVLIGANGAGKSNFIGFFRMLAEMHGQRFQLHVQREAGADAFLHYGRKQTKEIEATLDFDESGTYAFALVPTSENRLIFANERVRHHGFEPVSLGAGHAESAFADYVRNVRANLGPGENDFFERINPPIDRVRVYHFHDTGETARVKQIQQSNDTLRLKPDASNLAPFLRMLREEHEAYYRMIVDSIRLVAPFFDDFVHREDNPPTVELEWTEKGDPDTPFKAHVLSDGTLRFICLATLLQQPWELMPPIILLDEPELGLHPFAINMLASLLKRASERRQLIVATQSMQLLSCLAPEDVVVVDRKDNASTFRRLSETELGSWLDEYSLGELWEMNVLGGRPA